MSTTTDTREVTIVNEIREALDYAFETISSYAMREGLTDDDVLAILAGRELDVAEMFSGWCDE